MDDHTHLQPELTAISGATFEAAAERLHRALQALEVRRIAVQAAISRASADAMLTQPDIHAPVIEMQMNEMSEALRIAQHRERVISVAASDASHTIGALIEDVRAALKSMPEHA